MASVGIMANGTINRIMVKTASLALFISLWLGIILVGTFLAPQCNLLQSDIYNTTSGTGIFANPLTSIYSIIVKAFSDPKFVLLALGLGVATGAITGVISGANFSILYIIPLAMVIGLLQIFLLPTAFLIGGTATCPVPDQISLFYALFVGALTILTVMQFAAGRP